jgi:uncharacterized protein YdeI (YjbR/CyaY-like superfamily)
MNPKVDGYLRKAKKWREEIEKLRSILLDCGLTEEFKWSKPCYTLEQSNLAVILALKESCALLLCKGALLKDPHGILIKPGENSQSARQIRFTNVRDIAKMERVLKDYIHEAVAAEKAGLKVVPIKSGELKFPEEFQNKIKANPALKRAFAALTPGRQRAYYIYFSLAKQSKTRAARVEKCAPQILQGKGLDDDYRNKPAR